MVTVQSVTCQPWRPWRSVSLHGVLDGREERVRHRPELDLQPELHAGADRGRLDAQPDGGEERVGLLVDELDGRAGADRPLDADRRRLAEVDLEAEVVGQRRLDDLLLHLAVERDGDLLPSVVLPQVDQRVLLGELGERDVERAPVGRAAGDDDRLQGRRGEVVALRPAAPATAERSPIWMSPRPQSLPICPAVTDATLDGRAPVEDADRGDLAFLGTVPAGDGSRSRVRTVPENRRT